MQVVHEWNTAVHVQDAEADPRKRAFTVDELQALFDHADEQVSRRPRRRAQGLAAGVPGRGALFKVAYGFGLRRTEAAMLDPLTSAPTRTRRSSASYGVCQVRFGKAMKGSPPKRRSVLTVWAWVPEVLDQWIERGPAADAAGRGVGGAVAVRARPADRLGHAPPAVRRLPGRARPGRAAWISTRCAARMSPT